MCYVDSISYSRLGGCPYRCTVRCPCPVAPEQQPELAEAGKPGSWTFSFPKAACVSLWVGEGELQAISNTHCSRRNCIISCFSFRASLSEPGHSEPGHSKPGHSKPGHSKPGHSEPGHSKPGRSEPGHYAAPSQYRRLWQEEGGRDLDGRQSPRGWPRHEDHNIGGLGCGEAGRQEAQGGQAVGDLRTDGQKSVCCIIQLWQSRAGCHCLIRAR